jgi:hypothetical protein
MAITVKMDNPAVSINNADMLISSLLSGENAPYGE